MKVSMLARLWIVLAICIFIEGAPCVGHAGPAALAPAFNRAASIYISQDFINEQLALHARSNLFKNLEVRLDPAGQQLFLHGLVQVPIEELRAINLEPKLGQFRFQAAIHPEVTAHGHLILEFPLHETFFYPADSKNPNEDRIVVPVQMLSVTLASVRGYLAALSGDFAGFDRRTEKLKMQLSILNHTIKSERDPLALDTLKTERESLRLQLAAVPVERKQLQSLSKEVATMLGFTGEKELSLNDSLGARKNALILKIKLSQLAPYLSDLELGGLRVLYDKKDGGGENYLAIDINATLPTLISKAQVPSPHAAMKVAPSLVIRLNQALLESEAVTVAEKKQMGSKLREFDLQLRDDGLHVSGRWHTFLFSIPFDTIVDFVTTGPDVFEVRVRELKLAGIDLGFLEKFVLETLKKRLDHSLQGICSFKYLGEQGDHARALEVMVNSQRLVPAFPGLHLVDVDVREHEFLLKVGHLGGP